MRGRNCPSGLEKCVRLTTQFINDGTLAVLTPEGKYAGKPCSPRYMPTDPARILEALAPAMQELDLDSRMYYSRNNWASVDIFQRAAEGRLYTPFARMYCDHRGRNKFLLRAGTMRLACTNGAVSIEEHSFSARHDSPRLREFLDNPVPVFNQLLGSVLEFPAKIEAMRGIELEQSTWDLLCTLGPQSSQTIIDKAFEYRRETPAEHGTYHLDRWSLIQALTDRKLDDSRQFVPLRSKLYAQLMKAWLQ